MADPTTVYPVNDFGPAMRGMVIGGVGVVHVFLAQFAIGGGFLLTYFQWLANRGVPNARKFLDGYFKVLVLVSFVLGAMTGVAMWFTTVQVGARTIGLMVDEFHWFWATEWCFFAVEIVAGYSFLRYGSRMDGRSRLLVLGLYAVAAFGSLFWINGILSWQLTPGAWLHGHDVWRGFFNPSFWPSLGYRVAVACTLAALVGTALVDRLELPRPARHALLGHVSRLTLPMIAMPVFGLWFIAVMPADSREWLLGGSIAMTLFLAMAAGASLLLGVYAVIGMVARHIYVSGATAILLLALAFAATAAGEMVREGARKPFTVRNVLYSSSIAPDEVARLREVGSVADDPYPLRDRDRYPTEQLALGAQVVRVQCSACHTMNGANALVHLTHDWGEDQLRLNLAQLQRTKAFMPPFAGPPREVEAVVQLLRWEGAGAPRTWSSSTTPAALAQIAAWLDAAGTAPAAEAR